jgi:hypothetical protein
MVVFTRLGRPRAVTVDGKSVPFDYADGVMAVRVQPATRAVTIAVEAESM